MRIANRLILLCAAALAVMAFGASAASAQTITGIEDEAGGACNPCQIHVAGESELHAGTVRISTCTDEFEADIFNAPTGGQWGQVTTYTNANDDGFTCTREAGDDDNNNFIPWPITNVAETGNETGMMTVTFSLQAKNPAPEDSNPVVSCPAEVNLAEDHVNHNHTLSTNTLCPIGVRVVGSWTLEDGSVTHDGIVFHHSDD